jgi:manganese transport protein
MAGLLRRRIPLLTRRLVTMIPALIALGFGADPTTVLVLSQVVLSFGLPLALIPLIKLTGLRSVMGDDVSRRPLKLAGWAIAAAVSALNVALIVGVIAF